MKRFIYIQIIFLTILIGSDINAEQCKKAFLFMDPMVYLTKNDVSQTNVVSVPIMYTSRYANGKEDAYVLMPEVFEPSAVNRERKYLNSPLALIDMET